MNRIKFFKTYNYEGVMEFVMHDDIFPHLKVDELGDKEAHKEALKSLLRNYDNYFVSVDDVNVGVILVEKLEKGIVALHGGVTKAGFGELSRNIMFEFMGKLAADKIKEVFLIIPESKRFTKKLARDLYFEEIGVAPRTVMIDNKENDLLIYRRLA